MTGQIDQHAVPSAEILYDESTCEGFSERLRREKRRAAAFGVIAGAAYIATAVTLSMARLSTPGFEIAVGVLAILVAGFLLLRWVTLRDMVKFPLRLTGTELVLHHRHIPYTDVSEWTLFRSRHLLEVRLRRPDRRGATVRAILTGAYDVDAIARILSNLESGRAVTVKE